MAYTLKLISSSITSRKITSLIIRPVYQHAQFSQLGNTIVNARPQLISLGIAKVPSFHITNNRQLSIYTRHSAISTNIYLKLFSSTKFYSTILERATSTNSPTYGNNTTFWQNFSNEPKRTSRLPEPLEWSYLSVVGKAPLQGMTMGRVIDRAAELFGDREAVVSMHQALRKTYADLQKDSSATAAGLLAAGLNPGDRLGIWSPNCYEWVVVQFAAAKAGLVLVNINPSYRPGELEYCLNNVSMKGIVCARSFKTSDYYSMLCEVAPELPGCPPAGLKSAKLPHLKTVIMIDDSDIPGTYQLAALPALVTTHHRQALEEVQAKVQFDSACNVQFTSGTTGPPKGAVLSHHGVVNNALGLGQRLGYGEEVARILTPVPLYHAFGCVIATLTAALYGAAVVLPGASFSGEACVKALREEGITSVYGTPTMFIDMLAAARRLPDTMPDGPPTHKDDEGTSKCLCPTLRTGIMGGAPCPASLLQDVITELGARELLVGYGMTETSPISFQSFPDDPLELRTSSIGFPLDHTEVKVVDRDGNITPVGVEGELCVRGYSVFLGYWEDEAKTREVLGPDRWLKTGDLAVLDQHGYGRISGRAKDVIIRGGENIYPAELENFFRKHPRVLEAQVFGVPDFRMGEEVAVWLRTKEREVLTEEEFKDWCQGKIAHYKIPRYVLLMDDFPTTITGKIQKFKMREQTIHKLGLGHK